MITKRLKERIERADESFDVLEKLVTDCVKLNLDSAAQNHDPHVIGELFTDDFKRVPVKITSQVGVVIDELLGLIEPFKHLIDNRMPGHPIERWHEAAKMTLGKQRKPYPSPEHQIVVDLLKSASRRNDSLVNFLSGIFWIAAYDDHQLKWIRSPIGDGWGMAQPDPNLRILCFQFDNYAYVGDSINESLRKIIAIPERDEPCLRFFGQCLDWFKDMTL